MQRTHDTYIYNKKAETMSREHKKKLQSKLLVELVKKVYETVPTYKAKMDEIGVSPHDIKSIDDIVKLPFTTKDDLRDAYPFGMLSSPKEDIVRVHASSGTTGKMTVVGCTQNDLDVWTECVARSLGMAGITNKDTVHVAYGYGLFTGGLGLHYGAEKVGASVVPASSGNTKRQLTLLKDFGANAICCTPSYAIYLATEAEKEGFKPKDFQLKVGIFGAEPWSDSMRDEIEQRLDIHALDIYGLSEIAGPGVSCECMQKNGAHIQDDHFYPEIIDPETLEALPYGHEGELVFTTLTKTGQPLIRYRTRDIASLNDKECECGRTTVRMSRIKGRSDDMLIIRGVNVFPSQIEAAILNIGGIEPHYMIYVDRVNNLDTIEIEVEANPKNVSEMLSSPLELQRIVEKEINSVLGITARVKIVDLGTIKRSEGKATRVIDRRKIF